jgi:hypothetical protein
MTRDELIKLAVECHWTMMVHGYLKRGLVMIYPGDDPDPKVWREGADHIMDETVHIRDARKTGWPGNHVGSCPLSELRSINRPWIIGPFDGKFFSLKSQRIWGK